MASNKTLNHKGDYVLSVGELYCCGLCYTYGMYGCLGEGGFLILLSSTVGMNGDFDRDRDLDLLLDDDDEDDEELELELDRDERDEELDEDL